jgi:hypothetical protein
MSKSVCWLTDVYQLPVGDTPQQNISYPNNSAQAFPHCIPIPTNSAQAFPHCIPIPTNSVQAFPHCIPIPTNSAQAFPHCISIPTSSAQLSHTVFPTFRTTRLHFPTLYSQLSEQLGSDFPTFYSQKAKRA